MFEMVVRRGHVLSDALRRMERLAFDPSKPIKVMFIQYNNQGRCNVALYRSYLSVSKAQILEGLEGNFSGCFNIV